ncbi:MAG: alpha/beta hydrolase [Nitratireductor sp.]
MIDMDDDKAGWVRFDYTASDGLALAGRYYGRDSVGPHAMEMPVVCLPGLTRNSADFHELALHLSRDAEMKRRVLCLDFRGRGMSAHDRNWENYNPLIEAEDTINGLAAAGIEHAAFIGTSRGGLVMMAIAAMRPAIMKAIVLNDIGPEIDGRGLVRIKTYIERGGDHANWSSAVAAMKAAGQSQFPAFDDNDWAKQARLIFEERNGKIVRRYDPAILNTLKAINLDNPLPSLWPQFNGFSKMPTLAIRGGLSDLLSVEVFEKMAGVSPQLRQITVKDQGHAPDLGSSGLPQKIAAFLAAADQKH